MSEVAISGRVGVARRETLPERAHRPLTPIGDSGFWGCSRSGGEGQGAAADGLVEGPPGPSGREADEDATGGLHDLGGDFDDAGSPGAGLADGESFGHGRIVANGVE